MAETLAEIGEFGLIDRIAQVIDRCGGSTKGLRLGMGDDCAVISPPPDKELLLTCDSFVEGRHYLPAYISPFDLGRRVMTANISDIGAMGGQPLYALISLGLKSATLVRDIEEMYRGFLTELAPFDAAIAGGNLTESTTPFIDVTLVGEVDRGSVVRRSTAEAGQELLVTGFPGHSAAGLALLLSRGPDANPSDEPLIRAFLTPGHRARAGYALARSGLVTAMIDTSDGLLGDLAHICRDSGLGAEVFWAHLPISAELQSAATRLNKRPADFILGASDDYELIIVCRPEAVSQVRRTMAAVGDIPLTRIGRLTKEKEIKLVSADGRVGLIEAKGWDHFKNHGVNNE